MALLLVTVGAYGALSYAVFQRRREIGLRMALGALPREVLAQFVRLGMTLLLVGLALGAAGLLVLGRTMESVLFGVDPWDPRVLGAAVAVMLTIVLSAVLLPSHAASLVSPAEALRNE